MNDWKQVKQIFNSAMELAPENRAAFLGDACGGDVELRRRVDDLLADYRTDFLERPADNSGGGRFSNYFSRLTAGHTIGHYEILGLIGVGGMGEVYLARDQLLERKVAIKLLNDKYESNRSNVDRFIQEAKAASALNHPNILVIHEIGESANSHYIVSEYVDGKTLREVLNERKFSVSEVLDMAIQVASALAAAHAARIIHRDIKPENIVVRSDSYVKVLDFGLAKLIPTQPSIIGLEDETVIQNRTAEGMILGTVSYMSPEQAKGEAVDSRTDIFSLGTVIYEMVTGSSPFAAATITERLANLINKEPAPINEVRANVPIRFAQVVAKMLRKNRHDRYQTMDDLAAELKQCKREIESDPGSSHIRQDPTVRLKSANVPSILRRSRPVISPLLYIGLAVVLVTAAALTWSLVIRQEAPVATGTNYSTSPGYDQFLRGKVNVTSESRDNNETAIKYLEQAVALDPNLAPAYAELARAYNIKAFFYAPDNEKKKLIQDAEVAVEKSLMLNPDLPEAYLARGLLLWTHANRFPHDQAIRAYKHAIELNPRLDEAHHQLGLVLLHMGLLDEAWTEIERSLAVNPGNTLARFRFGVIQLYRGRYDEALNYFNSTPLEKNPSLWAFQKASMLFQLGRYQESSDVVEEYLRTYSTDEGGTVTSVKALLLAKAGNEREAEKTIRRTIDIGQGFGHFHHSAYNIASAYALLNKPDQAMKWLRIVADDGLPCYPLFENDANLNSLRQMPEFIQFMTEMRSLNEKYRSEFGSGNASYAGRQ